MAALLLDPGNVMAREFERLLQDLVETGERHTPGSLHWGQGTRPFCF